MISSAAEIMGKLVLSSTAKGGRRQTVCFKGNLAVPVTTLNVLMP